MSVLPVSRPVGADAKAYEACRLTILERYAILDSESEAAYQDLVMLARLVTGTSAAAFSLIDKDRQWNKAFSGCDGRELPRNIAFCNWAIQSPDVITEIPDAREDARFADNPLVVGEAGIRFYAGAPILSREGYPLGTLCVFDSVPWKLNLAQHEGLLALARQAQQLLELRRHGHERRVQYAEQAQARLSSANAGSAGNASILDRVALLERLESVDILEHLQQDCYSLAVIGVDGLARISNDDQGAQKVHAIVQAVEQLVGRCSRLDDITLRYGDKVLLLMPKTPLAGGIRAAERIRAAVQARLEGVSVSSGVVSSTPSIYAPRELLAQAERTLNRARQQGNNQILSQTASHDARAHLQLPG